ncbi:MAG: K(+)-stimulated pyrophosphate-energized sodium pump, partial [Flavobacteriales bacterium]
DLVGKVEAGIPEDDPRNPATIADNVGDNVGDVAGMGADLFGSYVATVLAAMVLGNYVISDMGGSIEGGAFLGIGPVLLPMMIAGVGIIISIIGTMLVKINSNDAKEAKVQGALNIGNWVSLGLVAVSCYFLVRMLLPETLQMNFFGEGILEIPAMNVFFATLVGLFVGGAISSITEYYTGLGSKPIMKIVEKSSTGAGTNIIAGLATGMISTFPSVILFAGAIWASYALAGFYGVALAASAMMATTAMQLAIDAFGPIADNAGGIAEMSEQPDIVRERTDILDAVGNTTAATGKGFAIASAALTSLALFAAYVTFTGIDGINIFKAPVLAMLFIGGMVPVVFSALAMNAVGKAAMEMVYEVRRQFKEIPGIMEGTGKPEYDKCVAISTKASLKEMVLPGVLTIGMPLLIAFGPMLFGMDYSLIAEMLGGYMAGVTVSGVLWAIFQNNAGGAWDNAKKSFEAGVMINGEMTYKGSDAHTAAITGDTVGDPFKDTSGPSMNILIKLTCLIGLVIAPILGGHGSGNDHSDVNNAGAAAVITAVENQDKSAAQDKSAVQDKNTKPPMQTYNINGERYVLEAESSEMIWRGSKIIGDDHDGTLSFTKGWISVEPNGAIKNGYFEIDMNTLEASIPGDKDAAANLTGHLKDADFFEVEKYPRATLNIGGGSMKDGKVVCKGELKIRDKVKSMKITGSYVEMDGNQIKMTSNIVFDRTDFGVVYKSGSIVQALGDKAIKDEIALESVMVFKK